MELKEVRHIGIFSLAKMGAAVSLVLTLITGLITVGCTYIGITTTDLISAIYPINISAGIVTLIISICFIAVIGMIIGFVMGAVSAIIYNLAAGLFGGIKLELE